MVSWEKVMTHLMEGVTAKLRAYQGYLYGQTNRTARGKERFFHYENSLLFLLSDNFIHVYTVF